MTRCGFPRLGTDMSSASSSPKPTLNAASANGEGPKNRSPSRTGATPTTPSPAISRTRSVRSTPSTAAAARASARKSTTKDAAKEEDAKAEAAAIIEDLRDQLKKTETASEEHQKQIVVLQSRLDEALAEQTKLEETAAGHGETISKLRGELQEVQRSRKDTQAKLEQEQSANVRERDAAATKEGELNEVIARLKDSLAQRESRKSMALDGNLSRVASFRGRTSPNPESSPAPGQRDASQHNAQLLLQKDKAIEDLRLELAEAHVKVMEVDRAGGGRMQALEKQLLDVRMSNAKLMEDNESYQYLLQEKTLSGDMASRFSPQTPTDPSSLSRAPSRDPGSSGNLADELETLGEEDEGADPVKKLEKDLVAQKEQNKALTLYINRIIGRLLATDNFEQLFENGTSTAESSSALTTLPKSQTDKALPVLPSGEDDATKENAPPSSLLQRAGSLFGGRKQARPRSYQAGTGSENFTQACIGGGSDEQSTFTARPTPSAHEDPSLAPRVPLQRGSSVRLTGQRSHRRTTSDVSTPAVNGAVQGSRVPSGGSFSPPRTVSHRSSLTPQSPPRTADGDRLTLSASAGAIPQGKDEVGDLPSRAYRRVSDSGYGDSLDVQASPPRSTGASSDGGGRMSGGAATVTGGKQMRPLRLVQEKVEAEEEQRRASRGSWMGWFGKGPQPGAPAKPGNEPPR